MAIIPGVSVNELTRQTWGQAVATELNTRVVHIDGKLGDGSAAQPMTGQLIIHPATSVTPLVLRRPTTNIPGFEFQATAGTVMGSIVGGTAGQVFTTAAGSFRFLIGAAELIEVIASLCKIETQTRIGAAAAAPLQIVDTNGGGVAGTAHIAFYPSATNVDTVGALGGYVGFNGEGFQVQSNLGALTLESVSSTMTIRAGAANGPIIFTCGADEVARLTNQFLLIGQTTSDADNSGMTLFSSAAAPTQKGMIRTTTNVAAATNLYLRHVGGADADNQNFAQFTRATGTVIGQIQQNGTTGVTYGTTSDYRLKDDLGPVADPLGKLAALTPKHLAWKDGSGEFDGFLAHEVQAVIPQAVSGAKDAVYPADDLNNTPGGINPQQLDYGQLVPMLTAALQAALDKVDALETRVAALEAV